jgi:hypothetical protein
MKIILVPLDFSDATAGVVEAAARLAKAVEAHAAERIRFPAERNGCGPKDKTSAARTLIATKLPA